MNIEEKILYNFAENCNNGLCIIYIGQFLTNAQVKSNIWQLCVVVNILVLLSIPSVKGKTARKDEDIETYTMPLVIRFLYFLSLLPT